MEIEVAEEQEEETSGRERPKKRTRVQMVFADYRRCVGLFCGYGCDACCAGPVARLRGSRRAFGHWQRGGPAEAACTLEARRALRWAESECEVGSSTAGLVLTCTRCAVCGLPGPELRGVRSRRTRGASPPRQMARPATSGTPRLMASGCGVRFSGVSLLSAAAWPLWGHCSRTIRTLNQI